MRALLTISLSISLSFVFANKHWDWNNPATWYVVTNWYVDPSLTSGTGTGTIGDPFRFYSSAINAASKYDTINIKKGTTLYQSSGTTSGTTAVFFTAGTKDSIYTRTYGTGARPVWTGMKTIATGSLTNMGGNYYSYTDAEFQTYLNEFVFDGQPKPMMKVAPNRTGNSAPWYAIAYASSSPYSEIHATNGTNYIVDTTLTGSEGYDSTCQIVLRAIQWNIVKMRVARQSGDTIYFNAQAGQKSSMGYNPKQGWGYFIQGKKGTPIAAGQWYFDSANKKVVVYIPDGNPSGHTLQVPIKSGAINSSASGLTFDGIDFTGFYLYAYTGAGNNIIWKNCSFSLMTVASHYVTDRSGFEFYDCDFYNNQNTTVKGTSAGFTNGPASYGCNNWKFVRCTWTNTGNFDEGLGYGNGDPELDAFYLSGYYTTIQNCIINGTGYNGVHIQSVGFLAEYLLIMNTNKYLSDGACFYNFYGNSIKPSSPAQSYIRYCTFINAIGNTQGVFSGSSYPTSPFDPPNDNGKAGGVYMDENSSAVEISDCNFYGGAWAGFVLNGAHDITMRRNTIFGFWRNLMCSDFNSNATYAANNIRFVSNICSQDNYSNGFTTAPNNMLIDFHNLQSRTPSSILVCDSNKYNTFFSVSGSLYYLQYLASPYTQLKTAAQWQSYLGSESNSTFTQRTSHRMIYNYSGSDSTVYFPGYTYTKADGSTVTGSVVVPSYGSVILFDPVQINLGVRKIYKNGRKVINKTSRRQVATSI